MKTSALVMGILGGVFGMLFALLAIGVGGIGNDSTIVGLGIGAFAFSIAAIVGGALTGSRAGWAAAIMLICGVGIIISISAFGVFPGALMLLGSLFAYLHHRHQHHVPAGAATAH